MTSVAHIVARGRYHHASQALKSMSRFTAEDIPVVRQLVQKGHTDVAHHVAVKMKTKEDRELLYQDLYQTWKKESNATERFTVGCFVLKVPLFFSVTALTIMSITRHPVDAHWVLGGVALFTSTLALDFHWVVKRCDSKSHAQHLWTAVVDVQRIQGYFKDDVCEMK